MQRASSAEHVVLRDVGRKMAVQPIHKEAFTEELSNLMGARFSYSGVVAFFSLEEVQQIRLKNEEFFVTVVGSHGDKDFRVKKKHLRSLFGNWAQEPSNGQQQSSTVTQRLPVSPATMAQLANPEPSPSLPTPEDTPEEGSIGAWSDEKPAIRRDGVRISTVSPAGPADQVGIQRGDFIVAIDDHNVFTVEELSALIRLYKAGQKVRIRFRHNTTINDANLIMGRAR
jgi:hypothetical protein